MSHTLARTFLKCLSRRQRLCTHQSRLTSYKAAVLKEVGKPLVLEERPTPKLNNNEVRIQVHFCSVNSVDCASFKDPSAKVPFVPGYELAGEVIEVGPGVPAGVASKGERVAALSFQNFGGFAEQCVVPATDVWRVPSSVELKEAAVLVYAHSTAVLAFSRASEIQEGTHTVISVGPAGLGLAAVDVAANVYRAKVIGLCDNEERAALVRDRGAFSGFTYNSKKLHKNILEATKQKGPDVFYDAVGGEVLSKVSGWVKDGGKIFLASPLKLEMLLSPPSNVSLVAVNLQMLRTQNPELYRDVVTDTLDLADQELIGAHISKIFELEDINKAIDYIESNQTTGKVVIEMDD